MELLTAVPPFCPLTHIPSRAQIGVDFLQVDALTAATPICPLEKKQSCDLRSHVIFLLQVELLTAGPPICRLVKKSPSQLKTGYVASGRLDSPPAIFPTDIVYHVVHNNHVTGHVISDFDKKWQSVSLPPLVANKPTNCQCTHARSPTISRMQMTTSRDSRETMERFHWSKVT